jgi:uncharacterized protein (TIGR00730 family)
MPDIARPASPVFAVTVFLSSATRVDKVYYDAATDLGRAIAREKWDLVYGGNHVGCMGALADGAREAGGRVIGVTPQFFIDRDLGDKDCDELVVVQTMRERKLTLEQRANAFIALPGGLGTFEELFEIIVGKQLGQHDKPIVILNVSNFYTPLLDLIRRAAEQHFVREVTWQQISSANTVAEAITLLKPAPTTVVG